jgi:aspartyl-tRNA(Asn)/glutamyl-tRNA(Gln) amidotransferase subunit B
MRSKEEAHDYRYFPDPDLLPLELDDAEIEEWRSALPELPDEKKTRFVDEYGLSAYDAGVLVAERATADYFEAVARGRDAKAAANWCINELFGLLNKSGLDIAASPVKPNQLGELLDLVGDKTLSGKLAKDVFAIMFESGEDPSHIVETRGMKQVTDMSAIEPIIDQLIADNPGQLETYKKNPKVIGWFTGQVMKATGGKANPQAVQEVLKPKLDAAAGE